MTSFTDRLYSQWRASNGGAVGRFIPDAWGRSRRYGAQPHAKRQEGYPTDQAMHRVHLAASIEAGASAPGAVTSRPDALAAGGAAPRPESQESPR